MRRMTTSAQAKESGESQWRQRGRPEEGYRPLVIVLAGPTAVGKSDVAAELCSSGSSSDISRGHLRWFVSRHDCGDSDEKGGLPETAAAVATRGHIVSADSVQAYCGVDIGANKPTSAETERTPHHLVDVVDPPTDPSKASSYNAADWMSDASYVIQELTSFTGENDTDMPNEGDCDGDGVNEEASVGESSRSKDALRRRDSIKKALRRSFRLLPDSTNNCNQHNPSPATTKHPTILPVVVGGTMMYLQWLVHGRPDAVRPTEEAVEQATNKIKEFQTQAQTQDHSEMAGKPKDSQMGSVGKTNHIKVAKDKEDDDDLAGDIAAWNAASTFVSSLGPIFAQRVDKLPGRDWYRLRRLLEVAYTVASKKSNAASTKSAAENGHHVTSEQDILQHLTEEEVYTGIRSGSLPDLGYDVRCFFLCPDERMSHFHAVDERCEQMLLRGLLRETATLYVRGGLPAGSQAARAIGYRQALAYLQREDAAPNDGAALSVFVDVFAAATRQYAKKQMQWFRRDGKFAFVPVEMTCEKNQRVAKAAKTIEDMCKLCPLDFEAELGIGASDSSSDLENGGSSEGSLPLSAQTKLDNEKQGKGMKFFQSKRVHLIDGSDDFLKVLAEADECTRKVQGLGEEFGGSQPAPC